MVSTVHLAMRLRFLYFPCTAEGYLCGLWSLLFGELHPPIRYWPLTDWPFLLSLNLQHFLLGIQYARKHFSLDSLVCIPGNSYHGGWGTFTLAADMIGVRSKFRRESGNDLARIYSIFESLSREWNLFVLYPFMFAIQWRNRHLLFIIRAGHVLDEWSRFGHLVFLIALRNVILWLISPSDSLCGNHWDRLFIT